MKVRKLINSIWNNDLPFAYNEETKLYEANCKFTLVCFCEIDGKLGDLYLNADEGLKYNGTSVPMDVGFLRNYYADERDIAGLYHDSLYALGGKVKGLGRNLTADECDDVFRGLLRETGFSRVQAGAMDRAVRTFAHSGHFGPEHDSEEMGEKVELCWVPFDELE